MNIELNGHWGLHITIDLINCNAEAISNYETIELWVATLVDTIEMEAYGEPYIVRFGKENKFGYTCVQLIQTSNICAHFSEDDNTAYIDVFSCKPFDPDIVIEVCNSFFGGTVNNKNILYRG